MKYKLPKQDINLEPFIKNPPRFNRKSIMMRTDKVYKCEIINIIELTELEKLFHIRIIDNEERNIFYFRPGQFIMIEIPGFGEIPISLSSSPNNREFIEVCIRRAGKVTDILHKAKKGSKIGIRGPFGTSFPMEEMEGHNVLLIAGGLGLAPLRAPIFWVCDYRNKYKNVSILYGAKDPGRLLFTYQYEEVKNVYNIDIRTIVEKADKDWKGPVGMITSLFDGMDIDTYNTYAIVCGPPLMFKFVCSHLSETGIPMNRLFVSLERRMHCGMGKCCRCMVGSTFTCVDGPVFDFWSVLNLKESI